ncbi:hypothetical protein D3C86_1859150 [compost metagenome]
MGRTIKPLAWARRWIFSPMFTASGNSALVCLLATNSIQAINRWQRTLPTSGRSAKVCRRCSMYGPTSSTWASRFSLSMISMFFSAAMQLTGCPL